ncbi:MAG TPA: cyclopropane-fatty-acyl-phospholipid synthase family protein [Gemmatimonadaceae bacterium]|nr:cyclopropane-fatty-acyl-phospholipid synthase family protein [Gemmatimonadaceae bacterium]
MRRHTPATASGIAAARAVLATLFGDPGDRSFAVRYWDGSTDWEGSGEPGFTLVVRSPGGLRRMLLPPSELHVAEAYVRGDIELEGDVEQAAAVGGSLGARLGSAGTLARLARLARQVLALPRDPAPERVSERSAEIRRLGSRHSRERDRAAVRAHYDMGNDFYSLWLDRRMVYSCGYFPTGTEDIDAAQAAKLEHICRKLRLREGERLLDIGCGWGGLVRWAAANHGVEALGITLSERQAQLANERIRADGLERRCRVEVRDYREFPHGTVFDKVVSVGMFEHVGRALLRTYFREAARLTRPGGLFLNHGIVRAPDRGSGLARRVGRMLWRQGSFIDHFVFPDGELVPLDVAVHDAEAAGFETRDVESLREHYALTLRQWVQRLERARAQVEQLVGAQAYRVWRLYMAASAHAFASGRLSLAQVLLGRPDGHGRVTIPATRADLYAPAQARREVAA